MSDTTENKNTENIGEPQSSTNLEELHNKISELEAKKAELEAQRIAEANARIEQLNQEINNYKFPDTFKIVEQKQQNSIENVHPHNQDLQKIEAKFKEIDYALENYPVGHEKRKPFYLNESYNGVDLLQAYWRYTKGEKIGEIFKRNFLR